MRRTAVAVVVAIGLATGTSAHADTVALLPLDGEKRLEIYGQPVAAELGRAMTAAGLDVVVVGAKMDVPDTAQLIVDGTIKSDKTNAIILSIRIRDPKDGTTLETLPANAASLRVLDKAAADLSSRVVPSVKTLLAARTKQPEPIKPVDPVKPPVVTAPPPTTSQLPPVRVAVQTRGASPAIGLLESVLRDELPAWGRSHAHEAMVATATADAAKDAALSISFEVRTYTVEPGVVPVARARVRVTITNHGKIIFKRIVRTDSVVGDKAITENEMTARVAREVLAITNAQLRRVAPGWR